MTDNDRTSSVFPKRFFPDHEPTYAQEEVMDVEAVKVGEFPDKRVNLSYTYEDQRHGKRYLVRIKDGEVWQVDITNQPQIREKE